MRRLQRFPLSSGVAAYQCARLQTLAPLRQFDQAVVICSHPLVRDWAYGAGRSA
jgi:hypothetical protein